MTPAEFFNSLADQLAAIAQNLRNGAADLADVRDHLTHDPAALYASRHSIRDTADAISRLLVADPSMREMLDRVSVDGMTVQLRVVEAISGERIGV